MAYANVNSKLSVGSMIVSRLIMVCTESNAPEWSSISQSYSEERKVSGRIVWNMASSFM
jgi:hypothetical protein